MASSRGITQHNAHEIFRAQRGKTVIERVYYGLRHTLLSQQFKLLAQGAEAGGRRRRAEKFARMGLEGQHRRRQATHGCCRHQLPQQSGMPQVHPVEIADRHCRGSRYSV